MDLLSYIKWILPLYATSYLIVSLAKYKSYVKKLPPGPSPLPIIGNLLNLLPHITKPHKYFDELAETHGPIMSLQLGSTTAIVVSNAMLAKQVLLNSHDTLYDLDAFRASDHDKFSIGPLSASSPMWRILRKIYNNRLLSEKMLESMKSHRYRKLEDLLCYMKECSQTNIVVDVGQTIYDASFDIISSTIFSMDSSSDSRIKEIKDLMECIINEIGRPNIVECYPILKLIDPQRIRHRLTSYCVRLFKLFDEVLALRLKSKNDQMHISNSYHDDLLDVMLDVMEEQRDEINQDHLYHLLLDLLGSGMDTTSKTVEWAMTELLRNPMALSKLQEELDGLMLKCNMEYILESHIFELPYLQAIVKETLRLHPAAPLLLPRKAEKDVEFDGFQIPKDTMLIVNAWTINRDPHTWSNPNSFIPERFLGSEIEVKSQFSQLFTFGGGKKICPGMPLAIRMISLVLGNLIHSFNWKFEDFEELQRVLDMDDLCGITIKKTKSLRAILINRS
ncbi:cytochrome P450 76AD1-like [Chenopodium quinoa]|uniref:Cytochrome P450 n=1 Tax=Chenopodium quinoa TaxID=63459 RepID=A0A803N1Q9_CHEQI|nr:cytochrome P450 76AD1-like [Chenopodium quinoa]